MKIACHQPYLFPHLGVFSKWQNADLMVWLDKTQYTRAHYSNRCKLGNGKWATIPVCRMPLKTPVDQVKIGKWQPRQLLDRIKQDYLCESFYGSYVLASLSTFLLTQQIDYLAKLNIWFLRWAGRILNTPVTNFSQTEIGVDAVGADERLIAVCKHFHADTYLSGSQGPKYMDREKWDAAGIKVEVCRWEPTEYDRGTRPWIPYMSVLDALCYIGPDTKAFLEAKVEPWI